MIKKRLKKLSKLTALIAVRQGYFLGRNIYELYYQPYLTIKNIIDKQDKSQAFLIGVTAMMPSIVYVLLRIIFDLLWYQRIVLVTGRVFVVAVGIQVVVLMYLGFWTWKVIKFKNLKI